MTEKEALILNKLKNWRNDLARKLGKPSYYILSNQDLVEAVAKKPLKVKDFLELKGWGRKKAEKYAKDIIEILEEGQGGGSMINTNINSNINSDSAEDALNFHQKSNGLTASNVEPIFSVSEFIEAINITVSQLGQVKIKGEISAISGTERGYAFFDLRDSQDPECVIKCVIFRHNFQYFSHFLEEGSEVIIIGGGNIYPKNGSFRVIVEKIQPVGEGAYKKALEKLRRKLEVEGYFASERKRPLPFFIKKIGLITSSHGAAIEDFRNNLGQYGFEIFFKNVYVEGDSAEDSIVRALSDLNKKHSDLDVIALIRGGGGWESLKAFNGERIAEAVVASRIPVLTGIGHEPDETIAGLSSDKDCSTPTAVANFLREHRERLIEMASDHQKILIDLQKRRLEKIDEYLGNTVLRLQKTVDGIFGKLDRIKDKLSSLIQQRLISVERKEEFIEEAGLKMARLLGDKLGDAKRILELTKVRVDSINPEYIFQKGYSAVFGKGGRIIKDSGDLKIGQEVEIKFHKGKARAEIKKIPENHES